METADSEKYAEVKRYIKRLHHLTLARKGVSLLTSADMKALFTSPQAIKKHATSHPLVYFPPGPGVPVLLHLTTKSVQ